MENNFTLFYLASLINEGISYRENSICKCKKRNCLYCHPKKVGMERKNTDTLSPEEEILLTEIMVGTARNSLENIHAGISPSSKTGDFSDVKVVTPYGEIPWNKLSRISNKEMGQIKDSMRKEIAFSLRGFISHKNKLVEGFKNLFVY